MLLHPAEVVGSFGWPPFVVPPQGFRVERCERVILNVVLKGSNGSNPR
jgi:hypothetical protein